MVVKGRMAMVRRMREVMVTRAREKSPSIVLCRWVNCSGNLPHT